VGALETFTASESFYNQGFFPVFILLPPAAIEREMPAAFHSFWVQPLGTSVTLSW